MLWCCGGVGISTEHDIAGNTNQYEASPTLVVDHKVELQGPTPEKDAQRQAEDDRVAETRAAEEEAATAATAVAKKAQEVQETVEAAAASEDAEMGRREAAIAEAERKRAKEADDGETQKRAGAENHQDGQERAEEASGKVAEKEVTRGGMSVVHRLWSRPSEFRFRGSATAYWTREVSAGGSWCKGTHEVIASFITNRENDDRGQDEALVRAEQECRDDPDCVIEVVFSGDAEPTMAGVIRAVMAGQSGNWLLKKWTNVTGTASGPGLRCLVYNAHGAYATIASSASGKKFAV